MNRMCTGFQLGGVASNAFQHDRFIYDQDVAGDGNTMMSTTPNGFVYGRRQVADLAQWDGWGWIPDTWNGTDPNWILVMGEAMSASSDNHIVSLATRALQSGETVDLAFTNDNAFADFVLGGLDHQWISQEQKKGFPVGDAAAPGDFYLWQLERTDNESGDPEFIMMYVVWELL